jgi:hypothetical protein
MSQAKDEAGYLRRPLRFAHLIWALIGLAASVFLIVFGGEGHPPGIVLLPVVWVLWALGHGGLWLVRRLAVRGRRSGAAGWGAAVPSWPPGLLLAAFGAGAATAAGVFPVLSTLFQLKEGRYLEPLWLVMTATWAAHGVGLAGLLLRRGWSGIYAALLCFGWVALLGAQIVDHLIRGSRIQMGELAIVCALMVMGVLFGWHLVTSRRIKDFLASGGRPD